jgi:putative pyoverdin transport system ATP-binding/permease protein
VELMRLLLRTSWAGIVMAAIAGILSGISGAGLIALINQTLKATNQSPALTALLFFGLCVTLFVTSAASLMIVTRLAQQLVYDLRSRLIKQILDAPLQKIESLGIPRLLATLTEDVEAISNVVFAVSFLFVNVPLLLGAFVYLFWLSPLLFTVLLIFFPIGVFSNQYLIYKGRHYLTRARDVQDDLLKHFRTATEGIKELKLHQQRRKAFLQEEFNFTTERSQFLRVRAMDFFALGGSWGLVAFFIPIGVMLFILPSWVAIAESVRSGYVVTIIFLLTPVRGILNNLPELLKANVALAKVRSLGLSLVDRRETHAEVDLTPPAIWSSLTLSGIKHTYHGEDQQFVLGDIDLTFRPGEFVMIVGGNGSGKSTLVKLLTGLYVPETGSIQFDQQKISDRNREWYRQQFSVVFSDFYLFDRLLGLERPDLERQARLYLAQLQLKHKVSIRDGKLSTTTLSQGQRKRLALLTAYLENRPIYVFDEWASDQDPVFKEIFYAQLLPELRDRGKTVIAISHDDHYFNYADRIIKLDYGKIEYDRSIPS